MERPLLLPELNLPGVPVKVIAWLARVGEAVVEGDRLLELLAGEASFELDAPISGILLEKRVDVDDLAQPGHVLGVIRSR